LEEEDEDAEKEDEAIAALEESIISAGLPDVDEQTALLHASTLGKTRSRSRRRRNSVGQQGTATVTQAVLMVRFFSIPHTI